MVICISVKKNGIPFLDLCFERFTKQILQINSHIRTTDVVAFVHRFSLFGDKKKKMCTLAIDIMHFIVRSRFCFTQKLGLGFYTWDELNIVLFIHYRRSCFLFIFANYPFLRFIKSRSH